MVELAVVATEHNITFVQDYGEQVSISHEQ